MQFKLVFPFWFCFMIMCFHFMYMSILSNFKIYMNTPWVICFSYKSLLWTQIVFRDMYVYFLCWQIIHISWNEICFKWRFSFSSYPCFHMFMFNFMYMSILSKLLIIHVYPFESRAFMHIFLWTRCVWICMYTLVCIRHTYTLKIK